MARRTPLLLFSTVAVALLVGACGSAAPEGETAEAALGGLPATCTDPPMRDCSFYVSCLERARPCGEEGYAIGYGDRYCRRVREAPGFSTRGRVWRDETMVCLQRRLVRFLSDRTATCEQIDDGAFDDHPSCYTQPGASICDLPASDWLVVLGAIDLDDLLSSRGRRQVARATRTCVSSWLDPFRQRAVEPVDADRSVKLAIARALEADPNVSSERLRELATARDR